MKIARWAVGPLLALVFALGVLVAPRVASARAPEPGDKVKITLHDGNEVVGELLGLGESGYRVSFGGMEVIVAYPSVRGIEVMVEDALLEEMRPGPRDDPRGRSEDIYGEESVDDPTPPRSASPPQERRPPPSYDPPRQTSEPPPPPPSAPRRSAPPPSGASPAPQPEGSANLDIPPKPRSRGGGLMTTGFILLGVGAGMAVSSAVIYEDANGYDGNTVFLPAVTATGSIMATAGVVMGVTGIIMKSVSGARRRRWERKYGDFGLLPGDLAVVPSLSAEGTGGLAIVGSF